MVIFQRYLSSPVGFLDVPTLLAALLGGVALFFLSLILIKPTISRRVDVWSGLSILVVVLIAGTAQMIRHHTGDNSGFDFLWSFLLGSLMGMPIQKLITLEKEKCDHQKQFSLWLLAYLTLSLLLYEFLQGFKFIYLMSSVYVALVLLWTLLYFMDPRHYEDKKKIWIPVWAAFTASGVFYASIFIHLGEQPPAWTGVGRSLASVKSEDGVITLTETTHGPHAKLSLPDHQLYLNNRLIFSSSDESSLYTCLVHAPMHLLQSVRNHQLMDALVIGGANGIAARNLLNHRVVHSITLVEPNQALMSLSQDELTLRMYHLGAFENSKVKVVIEDPFYWMTQNQELFHLIILDIPPTGSLKGIRLYTEQNLSRILSHLQPNGLAIIRAGLLDDTGKASRLSSTASSVLWSLKGLGYSPTFLSDTVTRRAIFMVSNSELKDMGVFKIGLKQLEGKKRRFPMCERIENPEFQHPPRADIFNPVFLRNSAL